MEKDFDTLGPYFRGNPYSRLEWPLRISEKVVVMPPHRNYAPRKNELVIRMEPRMAFGTGTHPTTALCISMIEDYLKKGDEFLDVGTGSGILMITAAKLGAEKGVGIDNNELAVETARQNLMLNEIEEGRFQVKVGNLLDDVVKRFDLVVANILTEIIIELLDDVGRVLKESGFFICSGLIERNTNRVVSKMKGLGFELLEKRTKECWVSMAAKQKG